MSDNERGQNQEQEPVGRSREGLFESAETPAERPLSGTELAQFLKNYREDAEETFRDLSDKTKSGQADSYDEDDLASVTGALGAVGLLERRFDVAALDSAGLSSRLEAVISEMEERLDRQDGRIEDREKLEALRQIYYSLGSPDSLRQTMAERATEVDDAHSQTEVDRVRRRLEQLTVSGERQSDKPLGNLEPADGLLSDGVVIPRSRDEWRPLLSEVRGRYESAPRELLSLAREGLSDFYDKYDRQPFSPEEIAAASDAFGLPFNGDVEQLAVDIKRYALTPGDADLAQFYQYAIAEQAQSDQEALDLHSEIGRLGYFNNVMLDDPSKAAELLAGLDFTPTAQARIVDAYRNMLKMHPQARLALSFARDPRNGKIGQEPMFGFSYSG